MYLCLGRIKLSVTDVFHNGSGKQVCILKNDSEGMTKVILLNLSDVDAIVTNLSILNIVETVDQVGDGGLSGTSGADERDLLTWLCVQADIV